MSLKTVLDEEIPAGHSMIARLDKTGDIKIIFDRNKPAEVAVAAAAFEKARRDGLMSFKVEGKDGTKGAIMHTFDPTAERIILSEPPRGGSER